MRVLIFKAFVAIFFISSTVSFAQNYNFTTFSVDEGLPQSEVNCIFEDSRGYLWLGTSGGGISKFDGKNFTNYEEKDGLAGQIVTAITEDTQGYIWISSTWGGLSKFNGVKFKKLEKNLSAIANISNIHINKKNTLFIAGGEKLFIQKNKTIKNFKIPTNKNSSTLINKIIYAEDDVVWLATTKGVYGFADEKFFTPVNFEITEGKEIKQITQDKLGNFYFLSTEGDIFQLKKTPNNLTYEVNTFKIPETIRSKKITCFLFNYENDYIIGTFDNGVYVIKKDKTTNYNTDNGLATNQIRTLYEDKNHCLWIGTSGQGLIKFTDLAFTYFNYVNGFKEFDVFTFTEDKNNFVWAASYTKGLFKISTNNEVSDYSKTPILDNFGIRALLCDNKNSIWIGGKEGVVVYKNNTFSKVLCNEKNISNVRSIFEDSNGNIWIAIQGKGVLVLSNNGKWHTINEQNGLSNLNVYSFTERNKLIYIGTGWGLFECDKNFTAKRIGEKSNLCNQYIGSMLTDDSGNIWIGTDKCIVVYDGKNFKNISVTDGLSSSTIYSLVKDKKGTIWSGNNKGIDKITAYGNKIIDIKNYGKAEGFKGIECNTRAALCDANGDIWFGTIKGVTKFTESEEKFTGIETPQVSIDKINLFYEAVDWKKYTSNFTTWNNIPTKPVLPYNQNNISIYFSSVNKIFPNNIQYSSILEGFDKTWTPLNQNSFYTYSNLPPGYYTFKVKAYNSKGNWSSKEEVFEFEIKKAYWQTIWFQGSIVLAIIALAYLLEIVRKKRIKLKEKELLKLVNERTAVVTKQKEEIEVLLKEVHHRVKNNLQIISSLLSLQSDYLEDQKAIKIFDECKTRIQTMALVHETLYRSKNFERIDVKKYIESLVEILLKTYSVDTNVTLKTNITANFLNLNTIIPLGLLLNEIISNSLKYAFSEAIEGEIVIEIHKIQDNKHEMIISDNGIGFDEDIEERQSNSLGLELVKVFTEQLNGKIEKLHVAGTTYKLEFEQLKN